MSIERARSLRRRSTEAEKVLWRALRSRSLRRHKFRRQHPVDNYVVDFVCLEARLIIEVDGGQHADEDPTKEHYLQRQGFRVLRFWNNEVLGNTTGVVDVIAAVLPDKKG